jgi:hypothetical protein
MDYMVRSRADGVEIDIPTPGEHTAALIETIESCCEGTSRAPSDEARKVSSIRVDEEPLYTAVTLTPEEGASLDIVEIDRTVHWAIEQVEGG